MSPRPPSHPLSGPASYAAGSLMLVGQTLRRQSLTSPSGYCTLVYQADGNLVLYRYDRDRAVWASNTRGTSVGELALQADGNLVLYDRDGRAVWATNTNGQPAARLSVRDEGTVVLEAVDGSWLWSAATMATRAGKAGHSLSSGTEMVEPYGGGTGFRFKIRNVKIDGQGDTVHVRGGGSHEVSFDVLHDCPECGNAVNQVIVGLAGQDRAQASVWNGKQRSGGRPKMVNWGTGVEAMAEDNPGPAEWVNVSCDIVVPDKPGTYPVRARYAQAYQGRLMTAEGRRIPQPEYQDVLGWWTVDRPDGPGPESTIGTITVREPVRPVPVLDGTMPVLDRREAYRDGAREQGVPEHVIDRVLRLARPRIELRPAGHSEGPVVGRYGGRPPLPAHLGRPVPDFIASVDCAALPAGVLDIPLPEDGHLLFFASRSQYDGNDEDRSGRVVYVPAGTAAAGTVPPEGDGRDAGESFPLHAHVDWNTPGDSSFDAVEADEECESLFEQYDGLDDLDESDAGELTLGGYASCPELDDPCLRRWPHDDDEAWLLLAQASITLTDAPSDPQAVGFWMIRRQDLAEKNFESVKYLLDWNP